MSQSPIADYSDVGPVYPIESRCPVLTGIKSQCGEPTVVVVRDSDGDASFYCMRHFLLRVRGEREQQAETESIVAEVPPPRKPKVGDIVHFQPSGGGDCMPAMVLNVYSAGGIRVLVFSTDSLEQRSYTLGPRGWHGPEEDE